MNFDKSIVSCIHHYNVVQNSSTPLEMPLLRVFNPSLQVTGNYWSAHSVCSRSLPEFQTKRNVQSVAFIQWLTTLGTMHLRLFHIFPWPNSTFLLAMNSIPLYGCTSLFIYSLIKGHLDCFQFLVIINKGVLNICMQVFM